MTFKIFLIVLFFMIGIVYSSFFEWKLHKDLMHKPFKFFKWKFRYPFERHALIHHTIFGHDESYFLQNHEKELQKKDRRTIPMAYWNGIVLILLASIPFVVISLLTGYYIILSASPAITVYYSIYEYFHWCMHEPRNRWFERTRIYKIMDKRHHDHHSHMNKNYNVVLGLADYLMGTLYKAPA